MAAQFDIRITVENAAAIRKIDQMNRATERFAGSLRKAGDKVDEFGSRSNKVSRGGLSQFLRTVQQLKFGVQGFLSGLVISKLTQWGTAVARAGAEMERITSLMAAGSGSVEAAGKDFEFVRREALRLGIDLKTASRSFAQLSAATAHSSLEGKQTRDIFRSVLTSSRAMGASVQDTREIFLAFVQMISKGNVQAEELRRQLSNRVPGAFQDAAKAMGVTTAELNDMLKKGEVLAEDMVPKLAAQMEQRLKPAAEAALKGALPVWGRFQTAVFESQAALAELGESGFRLIVTEATSAIGVLGRFVSELQRLDKATGASNQMLGDAKAALLIYLEVLRRNNQEALKWISSLADQAEALQDIPTAANRGYTEVGKLMNTFGEGAMSMDELRQKTDELTEAIKENEKALGKVKRAQSAHQAEIRKTAQETREALALAREQDAFVNPEPVLDDLREYNKELNFAVETLGEMSLTLDQLDSTFLSIPDAPPGAFSEKNWLETKDAIGLTEEAIDSLTVSFKKATGEWEGGLKRFKGSFKDMIAKMKQGMKSSFTDVMNFINQAVAIIQQMIADLRTLLDAGKDRGTRAGEGDTTLGGPPTGEATGAAAGGMVGAIAGGIMGSVAGPLGTVIGAGIGQALGSTIGGLLGSFFSASRQFAGQNLGLADGQLVAGGDRRGTGYFGELDQRIADITAGVNDIFGELGLAMTTLGQDVDIMVQEGKGVIVNLNGVQTEFANMADAVAFLTIELAKTATFAGMGTQATNAIRQAAAESGGNLEQFTSDVKDIQAILNAGAPRIPQALVPLIEAVHESHRLIQQAERFGLDTTKIWDRFNQDLEALMNSVSRSSIIANAPTGQGVQAIRDYFENVVRPSVRAINEILRSLGLDLIAWAEIDAIQRGLVAQEQRRIQEERQATIKTFTDMVADITGTSDPLQEQIDALTEAFEAAQAAAAGNEEQQRLLQEQYDDATRILRENAAAAEAAAEAERQLAQARERGQLGQDVMAGEAAVLRILGRNEEAAEKEFTLYIQRQRMMIAEIRLRARALAAQGVMVRGILAAANRWEGLIDELEALGAFPNTGGGGGGGASHQPPSNQDSVWQEMVNRVNSLANAIAELFRSANKNPFRQLAAKMRELRTQIGDLGSGGVAMLIDQLRKMGFNLAAGAAGMAQLNKMLDEFEAAERARIFEEIMAPIREFRDDILLDDNVSPLTGRQRMNEAMSQFRSVADAAAAGDAGAIAKLPEVARNLLGEGRSFFASGEGFSSLFNMVNDVLSQVLGMSPDDLVFGGDDNPIASALENMVASQQDVVGAINNFSDRNHGDHETDAEQEDARAQAIVDAMDRVRREVNGLKNKLTDPGWTPYGGAAGGAGTGTTDPADGGSGKPDPTRRRTAA